MRTKLGRPIRVLAVVALVALPLAACGSSDDDDEASDDTTSTTEETPVNQGVVIDTFDFGFEPQVTTIKEGELVTWINSAETTTHAIEHENNVEAGEEILFSAKRLGPGEEFSAQPVAGTFDYHCQIHPETMQGSIIVEPA